MAESPETTATANEAAPAEGTSPPTAGLAVSGAEPGGEPASAEQDGAQETAPKSYTEEDVKRLQAKLQRQVEAERKRAAEVARKNAEIMADFARVQAELERKQAELEAPNALMDPEGASQYWKDKHAAEVRRNETNQEVLSTLQGLYLDTGVLVTREDERLDYSSREAFHRSVKAIKAEISGASKKQSDEDRIKAEVEKRVQEEVQKALRESGALRFDAGPAAGSAGGMNLERYRSLSPMERLELRRTNPAEVDRMLAGMR